jgi:hypothetical protein
MSSVKPCRTPHGLLARSGDPRTDGRLLGLTKLEGCAHRRTQPGRVNRRPLRQLQFREAPLQQPAVLDSHPNGYHVQFLSPDLDSAKTPRRSVVSEGSAAEVRNSLFPGTESWFLLEAGASRLRLHQKPRSPPDLPVPLAPFEFSRQRREVQTGASRRLPGQQPRSRNHPTWKKDRADQHRRYPLLIDGTEMQVKLRVGNPRIRSDTPVQPFLPKKEGRGEYRLASLALAPVVAQRWWRRGQIAHWQGPIEIEAVPHEGAKDHQFARLVRARFESRVATVTIGSFAGFFALT